MILNHKDAFNFVRENTAFFKTLSREPIEELHAILIKGLEVGKGLRERMVGVVGSVYQPLDNLHQIREAMLVFYEANSIVPFKKIFIEQYDFAARNYAAK